ncbi:MAG: flagellar export chaperone FliS [Acidobacteriaceae bacterium]
MNYQGQTLAVMNGVELVVALYDGMIRFLYRAVDSVKAGDVVGRRESIRRVLEILTYLQARLRTDIGGEPAAALAEFYAVIYAQCVRASRDASIPLLEQSIRDVMNVRGAWKQVARGDSTSQPALPGGTRATLQGEMPGTNPASLNPYPEEAISRRWSA